MVKRPVCYWATVSSKTLYRLSHVTRDVSLTPFAVWPNTTRYRSNPLALVWVKGYIPVLRLVQANKSQMLLFGLDIHKGFEPVNTPVPATQPMNQMPWLIVGFFSLIAANKKRLYGVWLLCTLAEFFRASARNLKPQLRTVQRCVCAFMRRASNRGVLMS